MATKRQQLQEDLERKRLLISHASLLNERLREDLRRKDVLLSHAIAFVRVVREGFTKSSYFADFVRSCDVELAILEEKIPSVD